MSEWGECPNCAGGGCDYCYDGTDDSRGKVPLWLNDPKTGRTRTLEEFWADE